MSEATGDDPRQPRPNNDFELLKQAYDALHESVESDAGSEAPGWLEGVGSAARLLFDALETHQELAEGDDGALPQVTGEKPGLVPAAARLEREHDDMLRRARKLEVEVERQLAAQEFDIDLVRVEAGVLRDLLRLHVTRTNDLFYEAYLRVEGGEGG